MHLDDNEFRTPSAAYRGKPFWSWNGDLDEAELKRQIDVMEKMGLGGFFMHSRTGLVTEYLGEEWFRLTNACADEADGRGLEAWLYDEDRWPSGTAGGMVTENPEFRSYFISLRPVEGKTFAWSDDLIAAFTCTLDGVEATGVRRIGADTPASEIEPWTVLAFTIEESSHSSFYNGFTYVDTMNRAATDDYIARTHERYRVECGDRLGTSIKGIFTDEPHRGPVMCGFSIRNANNLWMTPWTPTLFTEYLSRFGSDLHDELPDLFLVVDGRKVSPTKWRYMELTQQLFLENFARPLYDWCNENNMLLTGHALHEDSLTAQACMHGSLMRFYEYQHYPGVDLLTEGNRCYWIVKQLTSAARQLGQKWLLSELYGCTGWQMDLEAHKAVGDWQALFGINLRCHHLSWYTMGGEAKRDYPASILHQSAWWREYDAVESYFARLGILLTAGKPICDLLVLNPIESVWSRIHADWAHGLSTTVPEIDALETAYRNTFHYLAGAQIDFDYGDEEMLSRLASIESQNLDDLMESADDLEDESPSASKSVESEIPNATLSSIENFQILENIQVLEEIDKAETLLNEDAIIFPFPNFDALPPIFRVGAARYLTVLIPPMTTMRGSTLALLQEFHDAGGKLVFAGEPPAYVDCEPSNALQALREKAVIVPLERATLATACRPVHWHRVEILDPATKSPIDHIFCQLRLDGSHLILVALNVDPLRGVDRALIRVGGKGEVAEWDCRHGDQYAVATTSNHDSLEWETSFAASGERAYIIGDGVTEGLATRPTLRDVSRAVCPGPYAYTLDEPNVCVLDRARFRIGDGDWQDAQEILKVDQAIRRAFDLPIRWGEMVQPWYRDKHAPTHRVVGPVVLSFTFAIDDLPTGPVALALEQLEAFRVTLNGVALPTTPAPTDWWVDTAFRKLPIPAEALRVGANELTLEADFYEDLNLEALYLLGDFGVRVFDGAATLTTLPPTLTPSDLTAQGLAFYGGAITYRLPIPTRQPNANERATLLLPAFEAACAKVVSGPTPGKLIAFPPHQADVTAALASGAATLDLEVILTRRNTFGPLHQLPLRTGSYGPGNFVTEGAGWSDDYQLYPAGLLQAPEVVIQREG